MKKTYLMKLMLSCIFLMSAIFASAQTGSLSGRVTDETNQPLPGATVSQQGTDLSTSTDVNGYFKRLNKAWEKTLGYELKDLEGKAFIELFADDIGNQKLSYNILDKISNIKYRDNLRTNRCGGVQIMYSITFKN